MNTLQFIENKTFDEIKIGQTAEIIRSLKCEDIELFAAMSGNANPVHIIEESAKNDQFNSITAHGMWGGALISAILGTELPGPGTIYLSQTLHFLRPMALGDTVTVRVKVRKKIAENKHLMLDCECVNQSGELVIKGEAEVIAPTEKIRRPRVGLPEVHLHARGARYQALIEATRELAPVRTAIVHPCDALSLAGALEAAHQDLIVPVLVGPRSKIEAAAVAAGRELDHIEIIDTPHSHAAAAAAVALAREAKVEALMKGSLHTDELMGAVVNSKLGLRTERRLSHVYALDVPHYAKALFITDAAINIYPSLEDKRDIVQNAIDLVHALGLTAPKVALLSAVETISPKIVSTIDAAAICKMADRGQITGGIIDGPLAFDNAISPQAAKAKGIISSVAGDADILVAPDLEAANMLAKQLIYLAGAEAAGVVLGARVPIMLTSRADNMLCRLASAALAQLFVHRQPAPAR